MKAMIQKFLQDEAGASAVEYGLLVSLIAVVIVARRYCFRRKSLSRKVVKRLILALSKS